MQLCLLESRDMKLVRPASIKEVFNAGELQIVDNEDGTPTKTYSKGDHVMLEGSAEDFQKWLAPFDGVWVGRRGTAMQEQLFDYMQVKPA